MLSHESSSQEKAVAAPTDAVNYGRILKPFRIRQKNLLDGREYFPHIKEWQFFSLLLFFSLTIDASLSIILYGPFAWT